MGRISCLFILFYLFSFSGVAQSELKDLLLAAGFEQVQIKDEGDTLKIFFEHRNFRNPHSSMLYAAEILKGEIELGLKFVPLYHNRPMGVFDEGNLDFRSLSIGEKKWFNEINKLRDYRFNFRLIPDFNASFGNYEEPFANRTNLILDTRIYLFPGLSFYTGLLIPVNNTLDSRSMKVNLGPSHVNYFLAKGSRHFMLAQVGLFFSDRYGGNIQYRYAPLASKVSAGLSASLTGQYYISEGIFYKGIFENWTGFIDLEWRLPIEGLVVKGTVGQFLFGDRGIRFDLIRQYGTLDFGLHISNTENGNAIGFQVAFPIFPGKIIRKRNFELRTTEEFRWEYSYFVANPVARYFRTGIPTLENVVRQYQIGFIQGQRKHSK
jgi:hypothetical protein